MVRGLNYLRYAGRVTHSTEAESGPPCPPHAVQAIARASRMLEHACGELSLAHYRVLAAIAAGDERASRIAARLTLGKPAISAHVEALCQRGLLTRSGSAGDQRVVSLQLTPAGQQQLREAEAVMTARLGAVCARTPDPQRVYETLQWLGTAMDEAIAELHARRGVAAAR
jgi:DNA-binding MarR family transcriptional regulator